MRSISFWNQKSILILELERIDKEEEKVFYLQITLKNETSYTETYYSKNTRNNKFHQIKEQIQTEEEKNGLCRTV